MPTSELPHTLYSGSYSQPSWWQSSSEFWKKGTGGGDGGGDGRMAGGDGYGVRVPSALHVLPPVA